MKRKQSISRQTVKVGKGLVNSLIDNLPFELHIPGYQFCGAGTKLAKRLARNDVGRNKLDEACKEHDIAYSRTKDLQERHKADKDLQEAASQRMKASDASFGEKMAAFGVRGVMNMKRKLGMGLKAKTKKPKSTKKKGGTMKTVKKRPKRQKQRVIRPPKKGGFLPFLLPLLAALGTVGGGAATIAKAVNDAKSNRQSLEEQKRHNLAMEQQNVSQGKGLYLRPYKGYGKVFPKN